MSPSERARERECVRACKRCVCLWHFSNDIKDSGCAAQVEGDIEVV